MKKSQHRIYPALLLLALMFLLSACSSSGAPNVDLSGRDNPGGAANLTGAQNSYVQNTVSQTSDTSATAAPVSTRPTAQDWLSNAPDVEFLYFETDKRLEFRSGNVSEKLSEDKKLQSFLNSVTTISFGSGVKEIGAECCSGLDHLQKVIIHEDTVSVGSRAFSDCNALETIEWGSIQSIGSFAFSNCGSIQEIAFPTELVSIGEAAFTNCSKLQKVEIRSQLQMGQKVFSGCNALISLSIQGDVPENAFVGLESLNRVTFGSGTVLIGNEAFSGCTGLKEVSMAQSSVERIGQKAFDNCVGLASIEFPETLQVIGSYAFSRCSNLAAAVFPSHVTTIDSYAFAECSRLESIAFLGENKVDSVAVKIGYAAFDSCGIRKLDLKWPVTSIEKNAFHNCKHLEEASVRSGVTLETSVFDGCDALQKLTLQIKDVPARGFRGLSALTELNLGSDVRTIGEYAFAETGLSQVVLSWYVQHVGQYAFKDCQSLTNLTIQAESFDSTAFEGCSALKELTVNVKTIPEFSFRGKPKLTSVQFQEKVETVERQAFAECESLQTIQWGGIRHIEEYAFSDCKSLQQLSFPAELETIRGGAFANCGQLQKVSIQSQVAMGQDVFSGCNSFSSLTINSDVAADAFKNCGSLTNVQFGSLTRHIGENAFQNCGQLKQVVMKDSDVSSIGANAFSGCGALNSLALPDTLETIGQYAFSECGSLTELNVPARVALIGTSAFSGCSRLESIVFAGSSGEASDLRIQKSAFNGCALRELELPSCVSLVESNAFQNCKVLERVTIRSGVMLQSAVFEGCDQLLKLELQIQEIPDRAFKGLVSLSSVTLAKTVTAIGESAFEGSGLTEINIPSTVESIGKYAFRNCTALSEATIRAQSFESNSFEGCSALTKVTIRTKMIPDYAFQSLQRLRDVRIEEDTESIGNFAFEGDSVISGKIELPDTLQSIGQSAFKNCSGLYVLSFSANVTKIGKEAFASCSNLLIEFHADKSDDWRNNEKGFEKDWWKGWTDKEPLSASSTASAPGVKLVK